MGLVFIIGFGLMVGSFLNVCIYRIPRGESIVFPRSHCPKCNHQIKAWENIPVLSFILLGGRCNSCNTRISYRYIIVEVLTALIFILMYDRFGLTGEFVVSVFLLSLIVIITFIDLDHQIIPNKLLLVCLIPTAYILILDSLKGPGIFSGILSHIWGALGLGLGFLFIGLFGEFIFKKESMGMGDVKYAALIGLILGWQEGLVASAIAFFSAAILLILFLLLGKVSMGQRIPFGPFLSLGVFVSILWGSNIIDWYSKFLN
ncbi:MAG: prepilin peptidase [Candidatus Marinimicrobia bacterium]|nr:prepilin peptidase [Candidatus Neomarinimicrobiota bacterium]